MRQVGTGTSASQLQASGLKATELQHQRECGGTRGPDATYLVFRSNDGFEFVLRKDIAFESETLIDLYKGPGTL